MEGRIADTSVEPLIVTDPADLLRPELRNVVMYETDTDAEAFGVADRDVEEVAIDSSGRDLIFGDVLVRVSPKYALEMPLKSRAGRCLGVGWKALICPPLPTPHPQFEFFFF